MTREDIDKMWGQALNESIKNGEDFTRYRFADLVAAQQREECLNLAKEHAAKYKLGGFFYPLMNIHITGAAATACDHVVHHIRARGTT